MATTPPAPVAWESPERVDGPAPGVEYAPHGGRLVAYILDTIILTIAVLVLARGVQTPGMRLFSLHVFRDRDGGSIGWGTEFLRLVGLWVAGAVFYIGFIWIFVDKRHRGWQDLIAGTVVVKKP